MQTASRPPPSPTDSTRRRFDVAAFQIRRGRAKKPRVRRRWNTEADTNSIGCRIIGTFRSGTGHAETGLGWSHLHVGRDSDGSLATYAAAGRVGRVRDGAKRGRTPHPAEMGLKSSTPCLDGAETSESHGGISSISVHEEESLILQEEWLHDVCGVPQARYVATLPLFPSRRLRMLRSCSLGSSAPDRLKSMHCSRAKIVETLFSCSWCFCHSETDNAEKRASVTVASTPSSCTRQPRGDENRSLVQATLSSSDHGCSHRDAPRGGSVPTSHAGSFDVFVGNRGEIACLYTRLWQTNKMNFNFYKAGFLLRNVYALENDAEMGVFYDKNTNAAYINYMHLIVAC